jgi:uncharacterized Zn-finger protein/predicted acylesterase/phospholipase RssA
MSLLILPFSIAIVLHFDSQRTYFAIRGLHMSDKDIPHFYNDLGAPMLEIRTRQFICIGELPPFDHPHISLDMGTADEIVCPYCSTLYNFTPTLGSDEARFFQPVSSAAPLRDATPAVHAREAPTSGHRLSTLLLLCSENLVQCWYIIVVAILSAMIVAWTEQGREALFASGDFSGFFPSGDPIILLQGIFTCFALLFNVYLLTVFSCFLIQKKQPSDDALTRYAQLHTPAIVGLTVLFLPIMFLQETTQLSTTIRATLILLSPLVILCARHYAIFFHIRKGLLPIRRDTDREEANALKRIRYAILAFIGPAFIAILASFWAHNLLIVAFMFWIAFLAADYFLYHDHPRQKATLTIVAAAGAVIIGWSLSDGLVIPAAMKLSISLIQPIIHSIEASSLMDHKWFVGLNVFEQIVRAPAFWFGSVGTLLGAFDFWVALGFLVAWGYSRIPRKDGRHLMSFIIVSICLWLFVTGPFNIKAVRVLENSRGTEPVSELRDHARKWLTERQTAIQAADQYPVFIVNADGGGVRSSYWTASLLSALQDRDPAFADHIFAISSVSGGSLGAAVFAAMVKEARESKQRPCHGATQRGWLEDPATWRKCAFNILHHDFLASALARMLVSDLVYNFLPRQSDRAVALEEAFEVAWERANGDNSFSNTFQALWQGDDLALHVPSLFLNCTDARTGKRLVLSNVRLGADNAERNDLGALLGDHRVRLSTGVLLSARFPVISPAGRLPGSIAETLVVDGGYVDNSGTLTAREIVHELRAAIDDQREVAVGDEKKVLDHVKIVTLMIANDPVSHRQDVRADSISSSILTSIVGSLLSPVQTLDVIRQAHTINSKLSYAKYIRESGGIVVDEISLHADNVQFPLGWSLARRTMEAMEVQIDDMAKSPDSEFSQVLALLPKPRKDN